MSKEEEVPVQEVLSYGVQDQALIHLVNLANHGVSSGVTLLLEGTVLYGDLMSGHEYCTLTASSIRDSFDDSSTELREFMAKFYDELSNEYVTGGDNVIPLNFLHLKNAAHLGADGSKVTAKDGLFRISIEKISGFSFGRPLY